MIKRIYTITNTLFFSFLFCLSARGGAPQKPFPLLNEGAECYLNSFLQCLFNIQPVSKFVLGATYDEKKDPIASEYQQILQTYSIAAGEATEKTVINDKNAVHSKSLGAALFLKYPNEDPKNKRHVAAQRVKEFPQLEFTGDQGSPEVGVQLLIPELFKVKNPSGKVPVDPFKWEYEYVYACEACKGTAQTQVSDIGMLTINAPRLDDKVIFALMREVDLFNQPCSLCPQQKAQRIRRFRRIPDCPIFRAEQNFQGNFPFETSIEIPVPFEKLTKTYDLKAIIMRTSSGLGVQGGHYYALVLQDDTWFVLDELESNWYTSPLRYEQLLLVNAAQRRYGKIKWTETSKSIIDKMKKDGVIPARYAEDPGAIDIPEFFFYQVREFSKTGVQWETPAQPSLDTTAALTDLYAALTLF